MVDLDPLSSQLLGREVMDFVYIVYDGLNGGCGAFLWHPRLSVVCGADDF